MNDFMEQLKNMDKKERRALLEKVSAALTPEQQEQVKAVMQDKAQMEKLQKNVKAEDLNELINGINSTENPADFLQSPRVTERLRELLQ
ncbi:MAG: hypothetical protein IJ407_01700 [Clostridia bacterium]|nr:hypothetical protein [Clostridia bacterium]MBQ8600082.1 hypothetical protein [Clostridia bacterium]